MGNIGYCSNQIGEATASSVASTTAAIVFYQILRTLGSKPYIQATPYGMVTTTQGGTDENNHNPTDSSYYGNNSQDQKEQFMQNSTEW